jgi:alpha-amylase
MMKPALKLNLVLCILVIFLSGCGRLSAGEPIPQQIRDPEVWWQDVVFYQIFPRSFKDSTGDGIGDFQGIIQMLDYLNDGDPSTQDDLGIAGIWLTPINPSPTYHGYDVTDYYAVNPDFGTMEDFKALLAEAEKRGIKIIIDLVINHTSNQHPWFIAAQDPDSEYHDWYTWSVSQPQVPGPWGQNAWHFSRQNRLFYYGIFWEGMPDLNFDNPLVSDEMMEISRFWLEEVGVHGFRVDAARYLFMDSFSQQDTPETFEWYEKWRDFYKAINPYAFTVGEVWTDLPVIARYKDGMDSLFMFDLAEDIKNRVFSPNPERITRSYQDTLYFFPEGHFSTFLSNHDQQRVMTFLNNDLDKMKMAAFIYLTGPGVPFIYYGEEIGMTGDKPDERLRTPMQWSGEPNAGFTTVFPWQPANRNYQEVNVQDQESDPDSLLNHYRTLVHLRNRHPALRTGAYLPLTSNCQGMYPVLRVEDDQALILLATVGDNLMESCTLSIQDSPLSGQYQLEAIFGEGSFTPMAFDENGAIADYPLPEEIEPYQQFILRLVQP